MLNSASDRDNGTRFSHWINRIRERFTPTPAPATIPLDADYAEKLASELATFKDQLNIHDLPPIFHYWSAKYLAPKLQSMGFEHPDDFFVKQLASCWERKPDRTQHFVSIGAGNCDTELRVATTLRSLGRDDFCFQCLEINPTMLARAREDARSLGLQNHFEFLMIDFNTWVPDKLYDGIIANQSLHHVVRLEHLFDAVRIGIGETGRFIVADMIGRNGHQLWPEAREIVDRFWPELPSAYRFNHQLQRHEERFLDWDSSSQGFEGVRAQDILALLVAKFSFELFLPFANAISPFVGRGFGHNFNVEAEWDRNFIDRVHAEDESAMLKGTVKPTQMFAVLSATSTTTQQFLPVLTPQFCVRPAEPRE